MSSEIKIDYIVSKDMILPVDLIQKSIFIKVNEKEGIKSIILNFYKKISLKDLQMLCNFTISNELYVIPTNYDDEKIYEEQKLYYYDLYCTVLSHEIWLNHRQNTNYLYGIMIDNEEMMRKRHHFTYDFL